jgi:Domain of unknown function (DUF4340)
MGRKILALLAVFGLFYGSARVWVSLRSPKTEEFQAISRLVDCRPSELKRIKITKLSRSAPYALVFERSDFSSWLYKAPFSGEADPERLQRLASALCTLYSTDQQKGGASPEQGAVDGDFRLEAELERSGERTLLNFVFPSEKNSRSGFAAFSRNGGAAVFVHTPPALLQMISLAPGSFRNLRIMHLGSESVQSATLKVNGRERFTLDRKETGWRLRERGKEMGKASEEAGKFLNRLAGLQGIGIEDPEFPAARCAGFSAGVEVELRGAGGKSETLRFRPEPSGSLSTCSSAGSMRYKVHKEMARYLDVSARELSTGQE